MSQQDSAREKKERTRRQVLAYLAGTAAAGVTLPAALGASLEKKAVTAETVAAGEQLAGLEFTAEERDLLLRDFGELLESYEKIRGVELANEIPPAFAFDTLAGPANRCRREESGSRAHTGASEASETSLQLCDLTVTELGRLLRSGETTAVALTEAYLDRLKHAGPALECVVSLTEERAHSEAVAADAALAAGRDLGPLHGIPWGAKDLLAARGARTTWGAEPFREQVLDYDAAVVERLSAAGSVLVAKLTLGALAWGDVWFDGQTRNPWNLEQGSSGSSAGSAAATAAALVGFAIGSETWGSIVSPCTRCGATGLRPTFGHVSRYGAMALSWTMDKLGPICRSVEDCALVLEAIQGADPRDTTAKATSFRWRPGQPTARIRLGYLASAFGEEREDREWAGLDAKTLETLADLGFDLIPIELPDLPVEALSFILSAEAATAFDDLTRNGDDDRMVRQIQQAWPNVFRQSRLIPAVEYIRANRVRSLVMKEMETKLENVDVYVAPSFGGNNLLLTNLTGHPAVVLPNGFREDGTPTSITFNGHLFGEADLLTIADTYQRSTGFHLRRPSIPERASEG